MNLSKAVVCLCHRMAIINLSKSEIQKRDLRTPFEFQFQCKYGPTRSSQGHTKGHPGIISSHGGSSVSLIQVMLEEKQDILNGSYSDYERDKTLPKKVPEFYYHTDVKIDFSQKRWYWNSTKEAVKETSWDNVDYFQSDFPWMQDAVALDIYSDKVLFHVFVSYNVIKVDQFNGEMVNHGSIHFNALGIKEMPT